MISRADRLALLLVALVLAVGYLVQFRLHDDLVESCERGNVSREAINRLARTAREHGEVMAPIPRVNCDGAVAEPWPF